MTPVLLQEVYTHPTLRMGPSRKVDECWVGNAFKGRSTQWEGFSSSCTVRGLLFISPTVSGWTWPCAHSYVSETCAHRLPLPWKYNICSNHTAVRQFVYLLVPYIYCKWEERHKEMNEPEQPLAMNMKLFLLSAIWRHLLRWLFPSWLDQNWLICGRPPPHWSLLLESSWPNLSSLWSSVRPTPTPYYIIYEQLINDPLRMKSYLNQIILNVPIDRGLVQEPHWRK